MSNSPCKRAKSRPLHNDAARAFLGVARGSVLDRSAPVRLAAFRRKENYKGDLKGGDIYPPNIGFMEEFALLGYFQRPISPKGCVRRGWEMRRPILLSGSPRLDRGESERAGPASPHAEAFSIIQTPHPEVLLPLQKPRRMRALVCRASIAKNRTHFFAKRYRAGLFTLYLFSLQKNYQPHCRSLFCS